MAILSLQALPQSEVSISKPELGYYSDTLLIMYDIRNCPDDAFFKVKPYITTSGGRVINAMNISGDLGDSIKCGGNKRITWSLAADDLSIN
ncbi:MAG: hypothetical protein U5K32_13655 [Bacteroidales bacterium]|nr:hypothetical protein [Bacteroidales bacterium]